mmetsp:Transcript_88743/g.248299  ORF Transcript_88743/g.248299 Transcript_88743/m.248299 type:complete len:281 (+) Transcript_88743:127-969(+)
MGQEVSRAMYHSECTNPNRHVFENSDDELPARRDSKEDVFFTPMGADHGNSIIIFDWDDTLLCSTAISTGRWTYMDLKELEVAVESILRTSMGLAETWIVTNGNGTWVQDSARRFMPSLLPLLSQLTVVSARALYERIYPGDPFMWKRAAFKHLLTEDRQVSPDMGLNLVALGDQLPEIEAAHFVVKNLGYPSQAKTVKFKEGPTVPELVGQLGRAERELRKLVAERGSGSRGLLRSPLPSHLEDTGVSKAAGWRFSTKDDGSAWFPKYVSLKDLWLLFS